MADAAMSPLAEGILSELEMRELYEQITVIEQSGSCRISHPVYGGHLTVYRPERDNLASLSGDHKPVIRPGYINGSSWCTGGISPKEIKHVRAAMLIYLRIMDIALEKLNHYNSVLAEWQEIHNPFDDAERLKTAHHTMEQLKGDVERLTKKKGKKGGRA